MVANVLVTGGAGFIGANVARALVASGREVVIADRLRSGGKWRNLLGTSLYDIVAPDALFPFLDFGEPSIDAVVHMAAVSATTETDVDRITRDNIRLSLDLWSWCARSEVPFLYASSAATYGDGAHGFQDDASPSHLARLLPLNAYGWSKHVVDQRIVADVAAGRPRPPQWAGLKFFNVYGPGEDHKGAQRSVVNKIFGTLESGAPVRLFRSYRPDFADGMQARDFVHVDDAVAAILWLLDHPRVSGLFNLGSGRATTWNALAASACAALGYPERIEYVDMPDAVRSHYQYFTEAPMEKLRAAGWQHQPLSVADGVARYAQWWRNRRA